jgi:dihydroorotase
MTREECSITNSILFLSFLPQRFMTTSLTITSPDDWHLHLRDGDKLKCLMQIDTLYYRAIIMPNLTPPVTTTDAALEYKKRIISALPAGSTFSPLMTLYLTDNTTPEEIRKAKASGEVYAVKLYPAGATTNSDSGVTNIEKTYPTLKAMEECDLPLLIHSEVTDPTVDLFDREAVFIERHLKPLLKAMPTLKVVMEHITTKDAVDFVLSGPDNLGATITCHHLLYNRNDIFKGGIKPHMYCLPVLKRETHRLALLGAIQSGSKKVSRLCYRHTLSLTPGLDDTQLLLPISIDIAQFFLGTDSAPHTVETKECAAGCAGCFTSPVSIELYAEAFDLVNSLDKLEAFCSFNGPDFYGLPRNTSKITLTKVSRTVPATYAFGGSVVKPLRANETVAWTAERAL